MSCSQTRSPGHVALVAGVVALLACGDLDTSKANRCETHDDCRAGRVCQAGLCISIASLPDASASAAQRPDGGRDAPASEDGPPQDSGLMIAPMDGGGGNGGTASVADRATPPAREGSQRSKTLADDDAGAEGDDEDAGQVDFDPEPSCEPSGILNDEIVLWLDAAHGIVPDNQGRLGQWLDRSTYAHAANAIGIPEDWPVLIGDAAHGLPAVRFGAGNGTSVRRLMIADDPSLQFGTAPFTLIAVVRYRNSTTHPDQDMQYGSIFQKACSTCAGYVGPYLFASDPWPSYLSAGAEPAHTAFLFEIAARTDYAARSALSGFNDDQVHVVVAQRTRDELLVDVDGLPHAAAVVSSTLDVSTPGVPVAIGAHATVDVQALDGEIFELVAIAGTSSRLAIVSECLLAKYQLR